MLSTHTLLLIGYTLAFAAGIVLLEGWLTYVSRVQKNSRFPMKVDDADWWMEWVVTASVALGIFLVINAHEHKHISVSQVVWALVAVAAGYSALPVMANVFCLDTNNKVRSVPWLIALNIAA